MLITLLIFWAFRTTGTKRNSKGDVYMAGWKMLELLNTWT